MTRSKLWGRRSRRLAVGLTLFVMPGLLAIEPVAGAEGAAAARPRRGVPTLQLPEVDLPEPSVPTEPDGTLSVPEDWDAGVPERAERTVEDIPELGEELPGRRDAVTEVFANDDGTETAVVHGEAVNYQPDGSAAWEKIDNTVVPDELRPGWVRNAANDWTVRFGPITAGGGGGVELETDDGVARFAPELRADAAPVVPVVGEAGESNTVTYPDVWPGVDVRYTVSGARVKEELIVEDGVRSEFPFVTEGLGLSDAPALDVAAALPENRGLEGNEVIVRPEHAPDPVEVTGALQDSLRFLPLVVVDGKGEVTDKAAADIRVESVAPLAPGAVADMSRVPVAPAIGQQRMVVAVDSEWMADQADGEEPVIIDPGVVVGPTQACGYGLQPNEVWCDGVSTGTNRYPPAQHWWLRGVTQFNYRPHVETKDVLYAGVWMGQSGYSTAQPEIVNIWEATGWSGHGAVAGGNPAYWLGDAVVKNDNHCFGADVCFDVTDKMQAWQLVGVFNNWWDGKFGFSPEEDDYPGFLSRYSYKYFNPADIALVMNLNTRPVAPTLVGPTNNSLTITTTTPTLRWNASSDADGDALTYTAKIATGTDGESGLVATSPASTATQWTVPEGVLQDGVTYTWKVFANDAHSSRPSEVRKLTVDRRPAARGRGSLPRG